MKHRLLIVAAAALLAGCQSLPGTGGGTPPPQATEPEFTNLMQAQAHYDAMIANAEKIRMNFPGVKGRCSAQPTPSSMQMPH